MGILLIHGAWHGAWCWSPVLRELAKQNIEAKAIDLPGHGADKAPTHDLHLADYAAAIVRAAKEMKSLPLLVGHSAGGGSISAAAELDPKAFRALLYVTAFLPRSGEVLGQLVMEGGANVGRLSNNEVVLDPKAAREMFYQDCAEDTAQWAIAQLRPESLSAGMAPFVLTKERYGSLPRQYVVCRDDLGIKAAFQRIMAARADCPIVAELDSGHSPFLAMPTVLTDVLVKVLRAYDKADA